MRAWLLVAGMLVLAAPASAKQPAAGDRAVVAAPDFSLPSRHGTVVLDSLRGRVVLVDFWASWCAPCRRSFAWMRDLNDRYAAHGLTIVAIDLDKDREAADAFLEQTPAPFVVAFDPAGKTAEAFEVQGMPSSYLIGPRGQILYSHVGFDPKRTKAVEILIQETCRP